MRRLARAQPFGTALGPEGFGANVTGGAGGTVRTVTNTNDTGAGSLRQAVDDANAASPSPSIIDIQVGGLITLNSGLMITGDNITIRGQNAPSPFIIRGNPNALFEGILIVLSSTSSNILLEHLRLHRGLGATQGDSTSRCLTMFGSDALIRHCSFAWGQDVLLSLFGAVGRVTFDYCMFYEPLSAAHHWEGGYVNHPLGVNFAKTSADPNYEVRVSLLRSVLAHIEERMPQCRLADTEHVNNIACNWGSPFQSSLIFEQNGTPTPANFIGCIYMQGNDSEIASTPLRGNAHQVCYINDCVWQKTNLSEDRNPANFIRTATPKSTPNVWTPATPRDPTALRVDEVWQHLKPRVGAILPRRSASDIRVLKHVENAINKVSLDGEIIDSPTLYDHNNVNTNPARAKHTGYADWPDAL